MNEPDTIPNFRYGTDEEEILPVDVEDIIGEVEDGFEEVFSTRGDVPQDVLAILEAIGDILYFLPQITIEVRELPSIIKVLLEQPSPLLFSNIATLVRARATTRPRYFKAEDHFFSRFPSTLKDGSR